MVEREPGAGGPLRTAAAGVAFGFGVSVVSLRFVPDVVARFTPLPWAAGVLALLLLSILQALPWGAGAWLTTILRRAGIPRELAFATGVYAATFLPAIFPWTPAGLVTPWPEMVQLAEIVGERGATLLIAFTAALLGVAAFDLATRRGRRVRLANLRLFAVVTIAAATFVHGEQRIHAIEAQEQGAAKLPAARIALVQPSIPAKTRWDPTRAASILATLTSLTRDAEARGAALTVWHETAYPYVVAASSRRCPTGEGAILGEGVHGPVLSGIMMSAGGGDAYNAAAVCSPGDELSEPYAKQKLLAFGESVPLARYAPWLRRIFVRGLGLVPGERNVIQTAGSVRASVLVCYEDILTDSGRDAMVGKPNLLVNVTNDAWFEGSAESELHLRLSAMRAIELRRDLVRAVNFGPTSWIDATGRVRRASTATGVLIAEPRLRDTPPTPFARFGDAPVVVALSLAIVAAFAQARARKSRRIA